MLPFFDSDHSALREQVKSWSVRAMRNAAGAADSGRNELEARAVQLVRKLGAGGFLKYAVPAEFGGRRDRVQARDLCILREELAYGDALADVMFAMQALGSYPITTA